MPFEKGKSGNPRGRPKKVDVCNAFGPLEPKALKTIARLMDSEDDKTALRAATYVIDRLHGKIPEAQAEAAEGVPKKRYRFELIPMSDKDDE